jgi:hypothetical protein
MSSFSFRLRLFSSTVIPSFLSKVVSDLWRILVFFRLEIATPWTLPIASGQPSTFQKVRAPNLTAVVAFQDYALVIQQRDTMLFYGIFERRQFFNPPVLLYRYNRRYLTLSPNIISERKDCFQLHLVIFLTENGEQIHEPEFS